MPERGALRLAIDATPLVGQRTGIGRFALRLIEALAAEPSVCARAYAVTWRGRDRLGELLPSGVAPTRRPMAARPLHQVWRRRGGPGIEWWTGPIDVVHGTNYVVPPARHGAQVVSVHDLTTVHYPELCTPHARRFPLLIRQAIERGAYVHADSEFVRGEVIEHFGARPDRVVTVHLGFDPVRGGSTAEARALTGAARYIVAVGTVEPRKGYPTLVRAFDRIAARDAQLHLVIVGARGWGVDDYDQAVRAARHRDRIVQLDYLDESARDSVIRGARVLAYPSVYEGFGFPPLEAMSVDVPVVATRAGSIPEVVGDAAALVTVGDDVALATALERALTDQRWRDELITHGRERIARFSWKTMSDELIELYRTAADRDERAESV